MLSLQDDIRSLVNYDLDCSDPAARLLAMRAEMVDLIRQRGAMGGMEACPNIAGRLKENHRPEPRRRMAPGEEKFAKEKLAKERPGRSRVSRSTAN